MQRLTCYYDLCSQIVQLKEVVNKRAFFCLNAASGNLRKTNVVFIITGDTNSSQKHCYETIFLSIWFALACSSTTHKECIVTFPLQNGYANVPQLFLCTYIVYLSVIKSA